MKAAIASLLFLSEYAAGSGSSSWNYEHMSSWSDDYPMCAIQNGSPINIKPYETVFNPQICDATFDWDIDFTKQTFKVSNNGHSLVLKAVQAIDIDPDHDLESSFTGSDDVEYMTLTQNENVIGTFPNYFQPSSSEHDSWCLDSLHFHWGTTDDTGSEHMVGGHQYALEVHFVHYSCAHASLGTTLEQFPTMDAVTEARENGEDTHTLGVVGIFFDVNEDETNPFFDAIFSNETLEHLLYPAADSHSDTEVEIVHGLDLSELIPANITSEGYYAYEGSLTTPPCTDIVRWHVMNARGSIGASQLELFRQLMSDETVALAPNYREVLENENKVYACVGQNEYDDETHITQETLSWWAVAVIASLATAAVMGLFFAVIHKKQETQRRRLHTNSFDATGKQMHLNNKGSTNDVRV